MNGVETTIRAAGIPDTPAYARIPDGAKRGMVVIHEIFGRDAAMDRVVDQFAEKGYATVAPDLMKSAPKPICIIRCFRAIASGQGIPVEQVRAATRWLAEQAKLPEKKIGVIGFCMGGGFALTVGRGYGAVSTNYGDVPKDELLRGLPPTIGCYGERDRFFVKKGAQLKQKLDDMGVPVEVHVFPNVGHSFLTFREADHPTLAKLSNLAGMGVVENPTVAADGWQRIFDFFDRYLPG